MFKQDIIGVVHPEIQVKYMHFLFYDYLQLIVDIQPTNAESELLFESGIIKPLNKELNLYSPVLQSKVPDVISKIIELNRDYSILDDMRDFVQPDPFINKVMTGSYGDQKIFWFEERLRRMDEQKIIRHKLYTPKVQAYSVIISEEIGKKAIPIIPEGDHYYTKFVDGYAMSLVGLPVPKLPIKDLISFKFDNQDKLRKLRLAINKLYRSSGDFESMLEELSVSLNQYRKLVSLKNTMYDISKMEMRLSLPAAFFKFITRFDISVFKEYLTIKKAKIQKQIDLESLQGSEVSYLYELGELGKNIEKYRY